MEFGSHGQDTAYGPRALNGKVPQPGLVLKEYLLEPVGADVWMKAIAYRTNVYSQCHVAVFRKRRDQLPVLEYADRIYREKLHTSWFIFICALLLSWLLLLGYFGLEEFSQNKLMHS